MDATSAWAFVGGGRVKRRERVIIRGCGRVSVMGRGTVVARGRGGCVSRETTFLALCHSLMTIALVNRAATWHRLVRTTPEQ